MCDNSIINLIDLSIEEAQEKAQQELLEEAAASSPSKNEQQIELSSKANCLILPPMLQSFDGSDNNPFDCVQKLANRPPDPFEMMEKEASVKARRSLMPFVDVKMANLISLADDGDSNDKTADPTVASIGGSTIYHSALENHLDSESPPISMSMKSTPDTGSGEGSASSTDGNFVKLRKSLENRKRLLKFSISNSTFNSPLSHHALQQSDSGFARIFSAAAHYGDHMIATESPVKQMDDDLMAEEPPKFADSMEKDYDADLEMLSIPMLKELSAKRVAATPVIEHETATTTCVTSLDTPKVKVPDIYTIREKLRTKRFESSNSKDVVNLIQDLKSLICENSIVVGQKKDQASILLEKLTTALTSNKHENGTNKCTDDNVDMDSLAPPPQPIVRQGTFDLELQESKDAVNEADINSAPLATCDTLPMTQSMPSMHSIQSLSPPREIPEAMFKSSATYDGEPLAEREHLILPIVEPVSPIPSPKTSPITTNPDINEIVEQLSKLLEQHQLSQAHSDNSNGSDTTGASVHPPPVINPTFIVVMPTAGISQQAIENSFYDDTSIPSQIDDVVMRRRSQSLSTHDKVRILKLPMRAPSASNSSKPIALPVIEAKTYLSGNGNENTNTNDFKTPMRNSTRRNSFSSSTSFTPSTHSSYSKRLQSTAMPSRYSICATRQQDHLPSNLSQQQQQAIVHPFPRANLDSFKPDLKRKVKPQTNASSSIMNAKAPLKAVIPIKKVAPMLTVSMPTPKYAGNSAQTRSHKMNMDMSMHLLPNAKQIPYTSTPMPMSRGSTDVAGPNACSTPALMTTPMRPGGTAMKNPRYLLTPTAMKQTPINAAELKKRALPELAKGKSPSKSRSGLPMSAPAVKGRLSLKPQSSVTRINNRATTRLSGRASISGGAIVNKENKKP